MKNKIEAFFFKKYGFTPNVFDTVSAGSIKANTLVDFTKELIDMLEKEEHIVIINNLEEEEKEALLT